MIPLEFNVARLFGIPIKVHLSLVVFMPILVWQFTPSFGGGYGAWIWGSVVVAALFVCIVLHELGHSLVAMRMRYRVLEILLLPIGGAAQMARTPSKPSQEFWMAIAGPAVSVGVAAACWGAYLGVALQWKAVFPSHALFILFQLNLGLALFNLIPSFPMDGGRVFRALMTPKFGRVRATRWAANVGKGMAALFILMGAMDRPFNILLIAIGFFLISTAGTEYRMVQAEEEKKQAQAVREKAAQEVDPDAILVSPSPYERTTKPLAVHPVRDEPPTPRHWQA